MDPLWFNPPLWCNALTLAERGATLSGDQSSWQLGDSSAERGQRRFERWRSQPPFTTDPYFAQRLAKDGIDQARLLYLLGEPLESLCARLSQPPSWLTELAEAFADSASPFDNPPYDHSAFVDPESDELESNEEEFSFLDLIQPFIDNACDRLQAGVDVLINRADNPDSLPFDPETIEEILLMNLTDPLLMRLSRTLVLELNVARLQGYLQGNTPKERYQSFIERIREPQEASAILAEYPVLARQLTLCINQWLNVSLEFLDRLCCDWELILCNFCSTENPGKVVDITGGAGDTHRGGRSVMIATFDSGFRIVYKPKSLAIDTHFQELLAWLNHNGNEPQFRTLTVVDRGEYGWVEYVNQQGCSSVNELKRFYRRHGAYLALLYTLNANDFHFENLIAVGEHPVLIDLETLFQPQFDSFDEAEADRAVDKVMAESVLQVGLLPLRLWSSAEYAGIDVSGFGGMAGQLSPERVPQLNGVGTDEMHFVRQRIELAGDANRPSLNDVEVSSAEYVEDVVLGFTTMYQLLTKLRVKLLADNGPLACFAHDEIRILLRPTRTYDQLLFESFHPDLLRDSLERERFLDRLWIAVLERPYLDKVIAAEQADLLQGDIRVSVSVVFCLRPEWIQSIAELVN
jgi:type 2 lantibiotic biosynthesis protein LanM